MSDVSRAREVLSLMRAGAIDGLSIGFKAVRARSDRVRRLRFLEKIDLWEISIVTFPMLPGARVTAINQRPCRSEQPSGKTPQRRPGSSLPPALAEAQVRRKIAGLAATLRTH